MKSNLFRHLAVMVAGALLALPLLAAPNFKIVVHPSNEVSSISRKELGLVFMKKKPKWENGQSILPVDQQEKAPVREGFTSSVHGKSVPAVRSFWQQQIFSGRDVPPVEKASDAQVIAFVKANRGAIGYVAESADTTGLKVLTVQ